MSHVLVELDVPSDFKELRMPPALDARLTEILDKQDRDGAISRAERNEAKALAQLADMLTLMKLRAKSAAMKKSE